MEDPKNGVGEEGIEENCSAVQDDHIAIKQEPRDDEEQLVDVSEPDLATNVEILGVDEELNFTLVDDGFVLGSVGGHGEVEGQEVASEVAHSRLQYLDGYVLGAAGDDEEVESQEVTSEAAPSRFQNLDHSDYYYNDSVVEVEVSGVDGEQSLPLMTFVSDVGDPVIAQSVPHSESLSAEVFLLDLQDSVHVAATLSPCKSPKVAEKDSGSATSAPIEMTVPSSEVKNNKQPQEDSIAAPSEEVAMEISSDVDPEATLPLIIESPLPDNDDEFSAKNLETAFSSSEEEQDPISFSNCEEADDQEEPAHEASGSTFVISPLIVQPTPSDDETLGEEKPQVAVTTSVDRLSPLQPLTEEMSSPSPCCLQLSEEETEVAQQSVEQPQDGSIAALSEEQQPASSSVQMNPQYMKELEELVTKSYDSYNYADKTLAEGRQMVKKMCEEVLSSYDKMAEEMVADVETMEKLLRCAAEIEDPSKAQQLLERLKACFNSRSHWIEVNVQSKRITEAQKTLKDYLTVKKGGIVKIQRIFSDYLRAGSKTPEFGAPASSSETPNFSRTDPFLVSVTGVVDPGEFYIVRWSDREERNRMLETLNDVGPVCPAPEKITNGQMYAALNSAGKWIRAIVETTCGTFMVGEGPVESLYECFLPDSGSQERISEKKFRVLPDDIKGIPPFAKPCTLNDYFKKQKWSAESTALFRRWTQRSPMDMQVFAQEGGVMNVDIAQIPIFGEEAHIASVRDSLMLAHKPSPAAVAPPKQFKPKYDGLQLQSDPLKSSVVHITSAALPNCVYFQIVDDQVPLFSRMQEQLLEEFINATNASPSYVQTPINGHPYALKFGPNWYRVLFEMGAQHQTAFFVDTGHRLTFQPTMCFHKLPERFMELPAQAVKGQLFSVFPPFKPGGSYGKNQFRENKYPKEIYQYLRQNYEDKEAVAFFVNWRAGPVGHIAKNAPSELAATVTLYLRDEKSSINVQVIRTKLARAGNHQIEHPDHTEIRQRLLPRSQFLSASVVMADDHASAAPSAPPQEVVESAPGSSLEPIEEQPMNRNISSESLLNIPEASTSAADPLESAPSNLLSSEATAAVVDTFESTQSNISNLFASLNLEKSADQPPQIEKSAASAPETVEEVSGATGFLQKKETLANGKLGVIVSERGVQLDRSEVTIPVKFHSVASPEEIYVRTMEQAATHRYLSAAMPEYYRKNQVEERKINFDVGFKCAVCIDDTWYRAEVVDMDNYPQVEVCFRDKAESHTVQASDIRRLPEDLTAFPQTLMRVGLFGVYPTSGTKWEPFVTNYITDRLRGAELITIGGRSHPTGSQPLKVQLVYVYDEEGGPMNDPGLTSINLNEELVERGYASRTASVGMVRRPARRTNWITKEQPRVGQSFTAKACWLNTKGHIFLQDVCNEPALERIRKYLTEKYKNTEPTQDDECCSVGDLCITTYRNDGYWYRAVVRGFLENGDVEVFYADYGTLDKVPKKDIRLNIDLEDEPVQTVRCTFYNLRPAGDDANGWESRIPDLNEIHRLAVEQKFTVHVKAVGPPIQVTLIHNGRNFNKKLVAKNLAEFVHIPQPEEPSKKKNKKKRWGPKKTSAESN